MCGKERSPNVYSFTNFQRTALSLGPFGFENEDKNEVVKGQTWRKFDIRYDVLAMVEGHQILQGVCVHNEEAAVVQADCQGFAIRGEAAAAPAWRAGGKY